MDTLLEMSSFSIKELSSEILAENSIRLKKLTCYTIVLQVCNTCTEQLFSVKTTVPHVAK